MATATTTAFRRAISLGLLGALATSVSLVNTLGATGLGSTSFNLSAGTFTNDTDVTVTSSSLKVNGSTVAAAGGTAPGVELASPNTTVNNALTAGNYAWTFTLAESGVNTLTASENLKIEVYGDNVLLATLYTKQDTAEAGNAEGVNATVDLGSSSTVPDIIDIVVKRQ